MATKLEEMKWKLHKKKYDKLFNYGVKNGLIGAYDKKLIENLRHIYYGGLPASILLLHVKLSNGHCYDRGTLVTLGFGDDDFQQDSDIERDKYALPLILPNIENCLVPTQPFYLEQLEYEVEILKQEVNYDSVCKEIHDDMKTKGFLK